MREISKDSSFEERSPFSVREAVFEGEQITITTTGSAYQADSYDLYIDGSRIGSLQDALRVMNTLIRFHERTKLKTLEELMEEERVYADICRTSSRKRW